MFIGLNMAFLENKSCNAVTIGTPILAKDDLVD